MKRFSITRSTVDQVFLALILLVCYTYFFPRWADPNQNSRLDMVVAVVDDGTFVIDKYVANTVDYALYNGHHYSDKPPGAAFLGMPVYAGLKFFLRTPLIDSFVNRLASNKAFQATLKEGGSGVYADKVRFAIAQIVLNFFIAVIPSVFLGVFLYRLLLGFQIPAGMSAAAVLIFGLLTPAFAYSGEFYSHQLSAALLVGAFLLARTRKEIGIPRLLGIGFLLAYAVISEYPTVLVAGILFFYTLFVLVRRNQTSRILWVTLVAGLGAAVILVYNKVLFGNPFNMGYDFSEKWSSQHQTGFMSLTMPHWDAIWGITFGIFRGVFVLSPILLLALAGLGIWWRSKEYRAEWIVSIGVILAMFLFNSSSVMWWGGFSVGPRYFLPALPFIMLGMGFALRRWWGKAWFRIMLGLSAVWSLSATWGMTLAGQAFPPDTLPNPYLSYALVNWQSGNIARNFATILGLQGISSLLPLVVILGGLSIFWLRMNTVGRAEQGALSLSGQVKERQPTHGA